MFIGLADYRREKKSIDLQGVQLSTDFILNCRLGLMNIAENGRDRRICRERFQRYRKLIDSLEKQYMLY